MNETCSAFKLPHRERLHGVRQIMRFNWPMYVGSFVAAAGSMAVVWCLPLSHLTRIMVMTAAATAVWWTIASLAASYWVYDGSRLTKWNWLAELFEQSPRNWVNIHAGFDETSQAIAYTFPVSSGKVLDMYDPTVMTESSITRARSQENTLRAAQRCRPDALPINNRSADAVFVLFAAHELRAASARAAFFHEVHRILTPGGSLVLVEHVRDAANFLAFGPGFFHFLPQRVWRNLHKLAGFRLDRCFRMTPFVRVYVSRRLS